MATPGGKTKANYSSAFAPIAQLVRAVRTIAVVQRWQKHGERWYRPIKYAEGASYLQELPLELQSVAQADAELAESLTAIAKASPEMGSEFSAHGFHIPQ